MERVKRSYLLILDFYGAEVVDWQTGELERSGNCQACFNNLNSRSHNYLRITRILKWLGEMALEHLKLGFLVFFANEAFFLKNIPKAAQVGMRCVKQPCCCWLLPGADPRPTSASPALGRLCACARLCLLTLRGASSFPRVSKDSGWAPSRRTANWKQL